LEPKTSSEYVKTLVILLHGFPDSGHLFSRQLQSYPFESAKLVALDLPGYGGSDSLPSYGPDQVLNAVAEGIIELKRRYLKSVPEDIARCILVGHDWGGVVGYRIAAESTGLIDEFVAVNSIYVRTISDYTC
jgi:pimeloyl-ACP methyl ester carboxylesterase